MEVHAHTHAAPDHNPSTLRQTQGSGHRGSINFRLTARAGTPYLRGFIMYSIYT